MSTTAALTRIALVAVALGGAPGRGAAEPDLEGDLTRCSFERLEDIDDAIPFNGCTLTIAVRPPQKAANESLSLDWKIRYTGPRTPLIILEPSLDRLTGGQTELIAAARAKSGKMFRPTVRSSLDKAVAAAGGELDEECFATAKDGRTLAGVIRVPLAAIRDKLRKEKPGDYDGGRVPQLYLRLLHEPVARGVGLGLDAWTGRLSSNGVEIKDVAW